MRRHRLQTSDLCTYNIQTSRQINSSTPIIIEILEFMVVDEDTKKPPSSTGRRSTTSQQSQRGTSSQARKSSAVMYSGEVATTLE